MGAIGGPRSRQCTQTGRGKGRKGGGSFEIGGGGHKILAKKKKAGGAIQMFRTDKRGAAGRGSHQEKRRAKTAGQNG